MEVVDLLESIFKIVSNVEFASGVSFFSRMVLHRFGFDCTVAVVLAQILLFERNRRAPMILLLRL